MIKYTKELHLQHVAAWWDGKLQRAVKMFPEVVWGTSPYAPGHDHDPEYYRIRPEPHLRSWKPEEVPVGALIGYIHDKEKLSRGLITHTNGSMVWTTFEVLIPKETAYLLEKFEHSTDGGRTWLPCGVEESV